MYQKYSAKVKKAAERTAKILDGEKPPETPKPPKPNIDYDNLIEQHQQELDTTIAVLERQQAILKARDDLLAFTTFTSPDPSDPDNLQKSLYEPAPFHKAIAKELEKVESGDIRQLIFCMPPRHGKTELATKRLAAWYLGRHPHHHIAVAAYSDTLASDFGSDVRTIIHSKPYQQVFPKVALKKGGNAKDLLETVQNGKVMFVGRGGGLTGRGAHLLLIDDIFKDHEEARSETIRNLAWNWFTRTAMTRRMGKGLVIITMTRWHSDDIIGRLTDPDNPFYNEIEARKWKIIRLPALAEEDDVLGREEGTPLWGERYDADYLESFRRVDPLGFYALFQQRPTAADGTLFRREHIRRYNPDELPENLRFYCASDHAVSLRTRNDLSCFGKAGMDSDGNLYFTELFWKRAPADEAVEVMLTMGTGKNAPVLWFAESGHISKSIAPFLRRRMTETHNFINIKEITPTQDKMQRATSIAARVAIGKVYFPTGAQWDKAIEELLAFPNGNHDDFVDMLSLFGLGLQAQITASRSNLPQKPPKFGTLAWVKLQEKWQEKQRLKKESGF
jgi:predicted phage terminase large subunit-like protein